MAGESGPAEGPFPIRIASGPRAVEDLLIRELEPLVREGVRNPSWLATPVHIVVPSRSLREHLAAALVRRLRAVAGVRLRTLHALALEILERVGRRPPGSADLFPVLVRQLAREERALCEGLDGLADGYGVVEAAVADLLDAGFEAAHAEPLDEVLASCGERGPHIERARSLLRVARRAAGVLDADGVGHRSRLFRWARELLERDPDRALPVRALFVHGFADATGVQSDLIEALVRLRGARVFLDHPPDPATLEPCEETRAFARRFGGRLAGAAGGAREARGDGVDRPEVAVLHAPGPHAEARAVATRLRALLDGGACPERIGVVARNLSMVRLPLRLHLDRLGIPFSGVGERGPANPAGRRLAALLALLAQRERTPAERWLDALAGTGCAAGREPAARPTGLSSGERADLRLALHALGAARVGDVASLGLGDAPEICLPVRQGLWAPEEEGAPRAPKRRLPRPLLERALSSARALCERWSRWPSSAPLGAHLDALRSLVGRDLGWEAENPGMAELSAAAFDSDAGLPLDYPLGEGDFLVFLERALDRYGAAALGGEGAGVQVLSVMEARARTFDHLFLMGLGRNVFPRTITEDPLLSDSLRRRLRVVMPELPVKAEGYDEERYLFAQLLSSSARVTLSCAVTDDEGRARPVSPLVERLSSAPHVTGPEPVPSLYGPGSLRRDPAEPMPPRPAHEHALLAGLYGSRRRFAGALEVALDEVRRELPVGAGAGAPALARARMAVLEEMEPSVRRRRELGPYFGFVGAPVEKADPRHAPPYITVVERVAGCPWQAFVGRLLRIEMPPDSLYALPGLEPRTLGTLVHAVLERIVSERIDDPARGLDEIEEREPVPVPWPDRASLDALVRRSAEAILRDEGIALRGFARVFAIHARGCLEVAREIDWKDGALPVLGAELHGAVTVRDAQNRQREVRFKVDRVDRVGRVGHVGHVGHVGRQGDALRLTDYKTGRPFAVQKTDAKRESAHRGKVASGELLQAAAYALADTPGPSPAQGRYLYLHPEVSGHARSFSASADDEELAREFQASVRAVLEVWDGGSFFPRLVDPSGEEPRRCQHCEVKEACLRGDSGARRRLEEWARRASARRARAPLPPAERAVLQVWKLGEKSP